MKSKLSTTILDKPKDLSKQSDLWDKAIADAHKLIQEGEAEIARLRRSIKIFTELKTSGAPFPGEELLSQESDLRVKREI
jgi:hypothetical protein